MRSAYAKIPVLGNQIGRYEMPQMSGSINARQGTTIVFAVWVFGWRYAAKAETNS